jgi:hypothetical protein
LVNKLTKTCHNCLVDKPLTEFQHHSGTPDHLTHRCKSCIRKNVISDEQHAKWRNEARNRRRTFTAQYYGTEVWEEHKAKRRKQWASGYGEKERARIREEARFIRAQAIRKYGGFCACCGENTPEFLTLDHVNRDGYRERFGNGKDRRQLPVTQAWYRKLLSEPVRTDLRVLCYNCNCGRERNNGICPHERQLRLVVNRK